MLTTKLKAMQPGLGRNPFIKGAASLPTCYPHLYFSRLPTPDSRLPTPEDIVNFC
ncbi:MULTISPECIES: hypothetical protein [Moorena]|uniref:hypothetical protein n=1 Tax=Moorena TaxID=1155738 RepID=UPI0013F64A63|nr:MULTISPECIES: hypothetical protein [Moorena]